jgi:hypothetical protein
MGVEFCKEIIVIGGTVGTGLTSACVALWKALTRCQDSRDQFLSQEHARVDALIGSRRRRP